MAPGRSFIFCFAFDLNSQVSASYDLGSKDLMRLVSASKGLATVAHSSLVVLHLQPAPKALMLDP